MDKVAYAENVNLFPFPALRRTSCAEWRHCAEPCQGRQCRQNVDWGKQGRIALQYIQTCIWLAPPWQARSRSTPFVILRHSLLLRHWSMWSIQAKLEPSPPQKLGWLPVFSAPPSSTVELGVVIASVANQADQSELRVLVTSMRSGTVALPAAGTPWATAFPNATPQAHTFLTANDGLVRQYVSSAANSRWKIWGRQKPERIDLGWLDPISS